MTRLEVAQLAVKEAVRALESAKQNLKNAADCLHFEEEWYAEHGFSPDFMANRIDTLILKQWKQE